MSISVITTNVFPGHPHVSTIIKNLGVQTTKDFEWVFVDAFYHNNQALVADETRAAGLNNVIHVPLCGATHVGRKFHWECYNNALLLATRPNFMRLGVWRYFHHQVVEFAIEQAAKGVWINLTQRACDALSDLTHEQIIQKYDIEIKSQSPWNRMQSHCGMFSFNRQKMIEMNGNNEALLIHHWEDCDLNSRWEQLGEMKMISLEKAFLRIEHRKDTFPYNKPDNGGAYIGKTICSPEKKNTCPYYVNNNHKLEITGPAQGYNLKFIEHKGFNWVHCPDCGLVAVGHDEKYFHYLKTDPRAITAPINVAGVGRNIVTLNEDIQKLTSMESKVNLLCESHTSPRYLAE